MGHRAGNALKIIQETEYTKTIKANSNAVFTLNGEDAIIGTKLYFRDANGDIQELGKVAQELGKKERFMKVQSVNKG